MDYESLKASAEKHGQGHIFQFWNELSETEKIQLLGDVKELEFERISRYFKKAMDSLEDTKKLDDLMEPVEKRLCGSFGNSSEETLKFYEQIGLDLISKNETAVLLLAGGQGTRLGVPYPKGMYNVGLPSSKTLYQIQAERLIKVQQLAKEETGRDCKVIWYIMTSEHTKEPTEAFFEKHNYFGLNKENVILFEQYQLPCLSFEGKIFMAKKHRVSKSPDGNGGLYRALGNAGILADMQRKGIQHLQVYGVDNILVKIADPIYFGFCVKQGAEFACKVVAKAFPTEPVGVISKVDGVYSVVEYSEISRKTAELRNPDGSLMYDFGNICHHYFAIDFLQRSVNQFEEQLKHHVAKKKIPHIDESGIEQKPSEPNGIKMEKFIFDVIHHTKNFAVWEVYREEDFSPLKNADGAVKDTPTTSRESMMHLHRRYIEKAGGHFVTKDGTRISPAQSANETIDRSTIIPCEISPLVSYAGEGLSSIVNGKEFKANLTIDISNSGEPIVKQQ